MSNNTQTPNPPKFGIRPGGEIKFYDMNGNLVLESEIPDDVYLQLDIPPREKKRNKELSELVKALNNRSVTITDNRVNGDQSEKIIHNTNLYDFKRAVNIDDYAVCTGYDFSIDGRVSYITPRGINISLSNGEIIFVKWKNVKYVKKS